MFCVAFYIGSALSALLLATSLLLPVLTKQSNSNRRVVTQTHLALLLLLSELIMASGIFKIKAHVRK